VSIASDARREAEVAESPDLRGTHTPRNYQPPTLNSDAVTIPDTHLHEFLAPFDRCSASPCAHNLWGLVWFWGLAVGGEGRGLWIWGVGLCFGVEVGVWGLCVWAWGLRWGGGEDGAGDGV